MATPVHAEDAARLAAEQNRQAAEDPYPADKARQGEIILRTPLERAIFIAGLVGAAVLALVLVAMTS